MSICKGVNLDLLNKCFELAPFHGLHTPHPDDVTEPPPIEAEDDALPDGDGDDEEEEEEDFDEGINRTV